MARTKFKKGQLVYGRESDTGAFYATHFVAECAHSGKFFTNVFYEEAVSELQENLDVCETILTVDDYNAMVHGSKHDTQANLSFGDAVELMKSGHKTARAGWNGKGMWVIYNPGSKGETQSMFEGSVYKNHGVDECEILPHFDMYTVNAHGRRAMLPGWLASQSDMDATDWCVVI